MRRYLSYIFSTLTAIAMVSCLELNIETVDVPKVAKLQLKSTELVATRTPGNPDFNENLISQVQLFFSADGENVKYYTKIDELNEKDGQVKDLPVTIPTTVLAELFPNETVKTCTLFVLANAPVVPEDSRAKISDVEKVAIGFTKGQDNNVTAEQSSFVMTGEGDVTLGENDNISGEVELKRVASKIEVTINLEKEITVGDKKWIPEYDNIKMQFQGLTTSTVGGTMSADTVKFTQTDFECNSTGSKHVITQKVPFYSYPTSWDKNSENVIILTIPWKRQDQNDYTTYKYQIPVNYDDKQLLSNYLYKLEVNVGILGTPEEEADDLVITPCSYVVIDWGTGTINAELSRPKYLVVDENYVVMNNENSRIVGFNSSDNNKVSAVITKVIKPDYSDRVPEEDRALYDDEEGTDSFSPEADKNGYGNTNEFSVSVNKDSRTITLNHTLNNEMNSKGFDYVPYTVLVKVTMAVGDEEFEEIIEFKQYPAMYVTAYTNKAFVQHGNNYYDDNNTPRNTFVNGWYSEYGNNYTDKKDEEVGNNPSKFGHVPGLVASSNANPNQYVLTVSSFSSDQPYVIADSRVNISDIKLGNTAPTWAEAYYVDFNFNKSSVKRQLQHYYPTNASVNDGKTDPTDPNTYLTGYYIAPKFRIASSYSVVDEGGCDTMEEAKRRCASYQENGYPAGRWRMATFAEIELIVSLSYRGIIPALFTSTAKYWCAHGAVQGNSTTGKVSLTATGGVSVRCVYDEWYWGSGQLADPNKFTWGDIER